MGNFILQTLPVSHELIATSYVSCPKIFFFTVPEPQGKGDCHHHGTPLLITAVNHDCIRASPVTEGRPLTQAEGSIANGDFKNNHNIENVGVGGLYDYPAIYEDPTSPFSEVCVQTVAIRIGHLFTIKLVFHCSLRLEVCLTLLELMYLLW